MQVKSIHIAALVIVFFTSCKWINRDEKIPAYLSINSISLDGSSKGVSNSHNLVDAWVSTVDGDIGVFSLPRVIPVLQEGESILLFEGGIYTNGQTAVREKYFFLNALVDTMNLVPGNTYDVDLVFTYKKETFFSPMGSDNFESSVTRYTGIDGAVLKQESAADKALEGTSAYVYDEAGGKPALGFRSKTPFEIDNQKSSAPVYLELDYRCSAPINVGLEYTIDNVTDEHIEVIFYATDGDWRHAYVDFSTMVNTLAAETLYRVLVYSDTTAQGDYVGIDNVKLLYVE